MMEQFSRAIVRIGICRSSCIVGSSHWCGCSASLEARSGTQYSCLRHRRWMPFIWCGYAIFPAGRCAYGLT